MFKKIYSELSPTGRIIVYLAVGFGLLAVVDSVFLRPSMAHLKEMDEEISAKEVSIKRELRFLSYKKHIESEDAKFVPYIQATPDSEEKIIRLFLQKLEMLATQSNINIAKINPTDPEQKKNFAEYRASLECAGTFKDVIKFMHSIDSDIDLIRVVKWNMTGKRGEGDDVSLIITIAKVAVTDPDKQEELAKKE